MTCGPHSDAQRVRRRSAVAPAVSMTSVRASTTAASPCQAVLVAG